MQIEAPQLLLLLQYMDSAFPTGAFAHSGGLETYTQSGQVKSVAELATLIQVKLDTAASTDLILLHLAHAAYLENDLAALENLDGVCHAMKIARETRHASERVGRRMLENVLLLAPTTTLASYRATIEAGRSYGHHAIVHGMACAALGVDVRLALLTFGAGIVSNQASAALKLLSIGQSQVQALITRLHPSVNAAVEIALTRTLEDVGGFAPALEIRAMQHEQLFRRLFIS